MGYLCSYKCLCQRYWLKFYRNDFKHDYYCNIVAFGGGLKCPHKIHLNTQCGVTKYYQLMFGSSHIIFFLFFFQILIFSVISFAIQLQMLAISFVILSILVCYSLMIVALTYYLIYEKENERPAQETSIEISVITPSAPVTNPRTQYLRSPSLPAYENVVSEQSTKNIETPPPNFEEAVNKFHYV